MTELKAYRKYVLKEIPSGWAIYEHPYHSFGELIEPLLFSSSSKDDCLALLNKSGASFTEKPLNVRPLYVVSNVTDWE